MVLVVLLQIGVKDLTVLVQCVVCNVHSVKCSVKYSVV